MLHTLGWLGIVLLGLFFAFSGAVMLVSPRTYFKWVSRLGPRRGRLTDEGYGTGRRAIELWTRVRGAMLLAAMAWVAYHGFKRVR